MAVTIKLKNASGSDPSASDLVLGELAVRTDNGKIFLKKDDGSVAEVSGGGIDDGDKGDITVSNSGATFTIDNDAVTYAKIQNVSATNRILGRDSSGAGVIEEISPSSLRTMINVEDGATADQTASEILTLIKTVDGSGSGLDADLLDGISSAAFARSDASDTLTGNTYTLSGSADQKIILSGTSNPYIRWQESTTNKAYIQWHQDGYLRIHNQEDGSILRVKDDIDFSSDDGSNYNSLYHEGNLSVGDGGLTQNNFTNTLKSKLDGIAASATNVTNNNQLTNGAGYITATLTEEQVEDYVGGMVTGNTETGITVTYQDSDGTLDFVVASQTDNNFTNSDHSKLDGIESGATADQTASEILTLLKTVDGSGSGLDADLLDGKTSGSFLDKDGDTADGDITFSGGAGAVTVAANSDIRLNSGSWSGNSTKIQHHSDHLYIQGGSGDPTIIFRDQDGSDRWKIDGSGHFTPASDSNYNIGSNGTRVSNGYFDTLHGDGSNLTNLPSQTDNNFTTTLKNKLDGIAASATNVTNNNQLTNGAGYTTYTANQNVNTGSGPTFANVYCNGWLRNNDSGEGLYNTATGIHWYSDDAKYWNMDNDGNNGGIRFRDSHNGTVRGYVYYDNSNNIGFLDSDGSWAIKVDRDTSIELNVNGVTEATILPDTVRCEGAFFENNATVAADKTISNGYNAMSAGPITINNSITVTVGSGESWTII